MTPSAFRSIGEQLYGPAWQEPLAEDLAVSLRSLQRWASGAREIPDLSPELAQLCHVRARELAALALELGYGQEAKAR